MGSMLPEPLILLGWIRFQMAYCGRTRESLLIALTAVVSILIRLLQRLRKTLN
jgi:hypothetical protein